MRPHLMKGQRLAQFPADPRDSPALIHQIMHPHLMKGQRLAQFPAAPRDSPALIHQNSVDSLPVLGI